MNENVAGAPPEQEQRQRKLDDFLTQVGIEPGPRITAAKPKAPAQTQLQAPLQGACPHPNFEVGAHVSSGPLFKGRCFNVTVQVRCTRCKTLFAPKGQEYLLAAIEPVAE